MLKNPASREEGWTGWFSHRSDPQRTPRVRLGSSLAAALLDSLLSILQLCRPVVPHVHIIEFSYAKEFLLPSTRHVMQR
jgi:hypothetical protein